MYDRFFEDSDEYTTIEVLRRAYALGVVSVCGEPDDGAYEQLKRKSVDTYDESIVELAYDEGRASALDLEADDFEDEDIWERLVEDELGANGPGSGDPPLSNVPEAILPPEGSGLTEGLPEHLDLPSFLRR